MAKLSPMRLIFGLFLIVLVVIGEIILDHFQLPTWPAFMIMIFFFVEHMDIKKAPNILVGGLFGIACLILAKFFVMALAPSLGPALPKLLFVVIIVYLIVALGEIIPLVFNNYAFMFLTVSVLAMKTPDPKPLVWMGVELIGGAIFIAGIMGILKIVGAIAKKTAK
jgi:hypothetical protein